MEMSETWGRGVREEENWRLKRSKCLDPHQTQTRISYYCKKGGAEKESFWFSAGEEEEGEKKARAAEKKRERETKKENLSFSQKHTPHSTLPTHTHLPHSLEGVGFPTPLGVGCVFPHTSTDSGLSNIRNIQKSPGPREKF